MGGAGIGVGVIFGKYLAAAMRNPSAAQGQFGNLIFGFAITEALGIFSLLIALLLLFALKKRRPREPAMAAPAQTTVPRTTCGRARRRLSAVQTDTFASQVTWLALTFILLYILMAKCALPQGGRFSSTRRSVSPTMWPRRARSSASPTRRSRPTKRH